MVGLCAECGALFSDAPMLGTPVGIVEGVDGLGVGASCQVL